MYTKWTQHLKDPDKKKDFEHQVWSSKPVLERLKAIIQDAEREISTEELSSKTFDNPNWALKQAHILGQRQALTALSMMVDLDQQKQP